MIIGFLAGVYLKKMIDSIRLTYSFFVLFSVNCGKKMHNSKKAPTTIAGALF